MECPTLVAPTGLCVAGWYPRSVSDDAADPIEPAVDPARLAFDEEALALADDVWRVARRLARDYQAAEDLVQEAYARAFRSWRSYESGTNLRAWLLRILHNLAIDNARKQQRAPEQLGLEADDYYLYERLGGNPIADVDVLVERLSPGPVLDALAELSLPFREVVVLVDLGDLSYQEAADVLEIPVGTVMSRLHRGRRVLKRALADHAEEGTA
ncbi:MAG: sigma-70 family RNA polymerase sigma factor [Thermoleophilia bacterium]|nr:sigma-70 family RNA polymerase sigma factor [Thermoleophilia bacterium]